MALVVLSKVEQRLDAVRAVLAGASVTEVAAGVGVSRVTLHEWLRRYLVDGLPGLADRSHRPHSCPHQVCDAVAVSVIELRRQHPRWQNAVRCAGTSRPHEQSWREPARGSRWAAALSWRSP